MKRLVVPISNDLLKEFKIACVHAEIDMCEVVREAIKEYLKMRASKDIK